MAPCGLAFVLGRWKSRPRGGRPTVPLEIRRLVREMSIANPLWGAPRIHGESCSNSTSRSDRRAWLNIWPGGEVRRPKGGRRSSAIMPTASPRSICSSCRQSRSVWFVDHGAWPTTGHMVRSNDASDRGMDRKPDNGSLRMEAASPLSDPRSGWRVW
jgi:hypothetical protein